MTNFILNELKKIEEILNEAFSNDDKLNNVKVILNFDEEFSLSEEANYSTPVVLIEPEQINSIKSGSKGQMINGEFRIVLLTIVAKLNRKFEEYFGELTNIIEFIRITFDYQLNVSYQFNSHSFINNYDIGNYPAIAVLSSYTIRLNNFDYS